MRLESRPDLDALERSRLRASGEAFLYQPLTQAAVFKKFAAFGDDARQNLSRVAVDVVLAGERLSVAEVKFLERLYEALGMEPMPDPKSRTNGRRHSNAGDADDQIPVPSDDA